MSTSEDIIKSRRGRKPKIILEDEQESVASEEVKVMKKRGRKPKGGKVVDHVATELIGSHEEVLPEQMQSVILHLKCSIEDIEKKLEDDGENTVDVSVEPFAFSSSNLQYDIIDKEMVVVSEPPPSPSYDMKHISTKLKLLEYDLHTNNLNKRSACFWCTYDFDTCVISIPKKFQRDTYQVYGCFCSPECATAYLMKENIDSSAKIERYSLINHMYSKESNYKKNINPAPCPYYMLDKFYGNLTIQEYRSLLKTERLFLTVEKPMSRILPEFHEDNEDFIINSKIIPSNFQHATKMSQNKKKLTNEKFGMNLY
jgi:hypothetical protein